MSQIPILFDLGGTIIDNIEVGRRSFNEVFNSNLSLQEIKSMFIRMSQRLTLKTLIQLPINPIKMLIKRKELSLLQNQYLLSQGKLFDGVIEFLNKLRLKDNILIVVVTQNPQFKNHEFIKQLFIKLFDGEHPFDYILSDRNKVSIIKKNFDEAALSKAIFIGDLPNDIKIAEKLNIPVIGVAWGYAEGKLESTYIVNSFEELYEQIEKHLSNLIEIE